MKTKKLHTFTLVAAIWASALILILRPAVAEMQEITDDQMEKHYLKQGDLRPPADLVEKKDINTEKDDLLEETEEDRLEEYIREHSIPAISEDSGLNDYWEYYDTYLDREQNQILNRDGDLTVHSIGSPGQSP
jgi:hypothetical protein